MAKKIIKAQDKIINRYSKTGLEQVNLDKKEIKSITSKIKDVSLNQNKNFDNIQYNSDTNNSHHKKSKNIQSEKTDTHNDKSSNIQFNELSENKDTTNKSKINISTDMAYDKSNSSNTLEGQFRTPNVTFSHRDISNKSSISKKLNQNSTEDIKIPIKHKNKRHISNSAGFALREEKNTSRLQEEHNENKLKFDRQFDAKNESNDSNYYEKSSFVNYINPTNAGKNSRLIFKNTSSIKRLKFKNIQNNTTYNDILIREHKVKFRNTKPILKQQSFSNSLKYRASQGVKNILDNKDKTDISNDFIHSFSSLNRSKKRVISATRSVGVGVLNIVDNHKAKKQRKQIYQRLKFDKDEIKEIKKKDNLKLREKSVFANGVATVFKSTKNTVASKYATALETSDKSDTANVVLKDVKNIKSAYSDIRQGFSSRKIRKRLKARGKELKEKKSALIHKKSNITIDKKALHKKIIKKNYAKKLFKSGQNSITQSIAKLSSNILKNVSINIQRAIIWATSAIVNTILLPIAGIFSAFLIISLCISLFLGSLAQVFAYAYPAYDKDVTEVNQEFSKMELEIERKAWNPPSGYDEYTFDIGYVGHRSEDLIAYFSVKYYKEKFNLYKVKDELLDIISEAYKDESWVEEIKIEHSSTSIDEAGNEYTDYWYEYKYIYHSILRTKDVSEILRSRLTSDELKEFERFRETKGLFDIMNAPLDVDYKSVVVRKYGYQFELNSKDKIEYNDFIELSANKNDNVYAMLTGFIHSYSDYIELRTTDGNRVRYYNVILTTDKTQVKKGEIIGVVSEEVKENGEMVSNIRIQILDKHNNILDPFFYIPSKIDGEIQINNNLNITNIDIGDINPSGSGKDTVELAKSFVGKNGAYMFKNFITPITGHTTEEWCADFCAAVITHSIGGSIKGNTIYDKDGKPFINWSASVANWADYANASGLLHKADGSYKPKAGDLILSYGNHIEMIADPDNFTTISGNSGHNNDNLSTVKVKRAGSTQGWINFSPRWTNANTFIISIPYENE